jgi:hypothetical protein
MVAQVTGDTSTGDTSLTGQHQGPGARGGKWRLLLPGASEPRLPELNPSGL